MEGDIQDYWNECQLMPSLAPEEETGFKSCEEGELEVEWLEDVGLNQVAAAFHQGQQVTATELDTIVQHFSPGQAEAVRRRVRTLNNTVRQRKSRHRARKADVRDLFKDIEPHRPSQSSNDSDGLDSGQFTTTIHLGDESLQQRRRNVARFPSVPLSSSHPFRNYNPDVAGSDGLRLLSFNYLGTLPRHRSGSDPFILDDGDGGTDNNPLRNSSRLSRSHGSLLEVTQQYSGCGDSRNSETDRTWIGGLAASDVEQLKPLLVAEATTILDDYSTHAYKRKPLRLSKKPEGNVFGVPLATLVEKDSRFANQDQSPVPAVLHMLVNHLEKNHLKEEGLLRVAGLKTRIDSLVATIEANFYQKKPSVEKLLFSVSPHDVTAVLKKLLRELPEPLLTYKLILRFYSTHAMLNRDIQKYVLNLLTLQLPREHQATLRLLFQFVNKMLEAEEHNKMGLHSIATILAPSIFPPRSVAQSKDDMKSQVQLAERCIKLTELLLSEGESLWLVPRKLINQLRSLNQKENNRPSLFRNSKGKDTTSEGVVETMFVEAPQFHLPPFQIPVSESLTAKEVVLKVITEGINQCEGNLNEPIKMLPRGRMKPSGEVTGMALSCVLSGAAPETALQTHFLFEYGGNIVQRELEHGALVTNVLRDNPAARWKLECRHRNCPKR